ncbi:hypothetical protein ALI144C_36195 [Actinosynnema sp. ALI-1.44]|uniref:hypothetical protein n=1 Tax=Actinosynnema sp. ALI-1.44 TaxID=1933779 RepID=UPI00097C4815|nr:hypothetical protein [Actinosynnema sp. ALI-1.44]ONI76130.1 hypothetical protein ALI144C_36195 [Actinosynnema sp. ALI-1.44]
MDAETRNAIAVVDIDPGQAGEWFDLVNDAHSASDDDWDAFSDQLRSTAGGAFGAAAEAFLEYAAEHGRIELVNDLVQDLPELPSAYAVIREQAAGSPWDDVVQQFGPSWAGWDGSEEGWAQFRDWTYSSANAQDPGMYAAAYEKLDPLNGRPLAERINQLTEFGFTVNAPADQQADNAGIPSMSEIIEESLTEALQEVPGSEELTPEELDQLRAEIADELAREDAG